jgi:hypothetical protein
MKMLLLIQSCALLVKIDLMIRLRALQSIHTLVRNSRVSVRMSHDKLDITTICRAMDLACVLYIKPVLCLQRSAATALLLRRYGWRSEMVIGAQVIPFKSHAWVEVEGTVVNDKPYMHEIYCVLERC